MNKHFNKNKLLPFVLPFLFLFSHCHSSSSSDKLLIATAANMQFAMEAISQAFSQESGIAIETIVSSSGKLTAQIKEGAPYDVFVSANMKYPQDLYEHGYTTKQPEVYAFGQLVLWTLKDSLPALVDLKNNTQLRHLAIANPRNAPYGRAAIEVLQHYGLYESWQDKLVYGESIAQTNQFILSEAADLGFTAQSVVLSPNVVGRGKWLPIDSSNYSPIAQGIVIIKKKNSSTERAQKFYDFLFSKQGKEILSTFGYQIKD